MFYDYLLNFAFQWVWNKGKLLATHQSTKKENTTKNSEQIYKIQDKKVRTKLNKDTKKSPRKQLNKYIKPAFGEEEKQSEEKIVKFGAVFS